MRALYLVSVWLHVLAMAIWLGGIVFLGLVLMPTLRRPEHREIAAPLVDQTGARFRVVAWGSLGLLVLTGGLNLMARDFEWADWGTPFGRALGVKLLLFVGIVILSALHDFVIGPRATALRRQDPDSEEARRLWRRAGLLGRVNLILALAVVALGVMLARGGL